MFELKKLNDRVAKRVSLHKDSQSDTSCTDVAIIGMAGTFAGAGDLEKYWKLLVNGEDGIRDLPGSREKYFKILQSVEDNKKILATGNNAKKAGYIDRIDCFDHNFFGVSKQEARLMDPNQRLILQNIYHSIENAGYSGKHIRGSKTGVYIGHSTDFGDEYKKYLLELEPEKAQYGISGNIKSIIASRISYILNLKGPALMIDSACSSSLVAVHIACQALRNGECDMAIAGGIKTGLQLLDYSGENAGIESTSNKSRTFDEKADGIGIGEGYGSVILKPLDDALTDGDLILATIKGSAVNQDGASVGITAPNSRAQKDLLIKAWENSKIDPSTISYIETHGTGTKLGDPIEIEGIRSAFANYTDKKQFCGIGSVKTNIGHLDNASGIASLIKMVLALKYKQIPPTINFTDPNSTIDFINSPVYVNTKLSDWPLIEEKRRCGISSFGLSGTNCHIVLEEAPQKEKVNSSGKYQLLTISAKTKKSLRKLINAYLEYLKNVYEENIENICYTSNVGREHYNKRVLVYAKDRKKFIELLSNISTMNSDYFDKISIENGYMINAGLNDNVEYEKIEKTIDDINWESIKIDDVDENDCIQVGKSFIIGKEIKWDELYKKESRCKVEIPNYPFEETECWLYKKNTTFTNNIHPLIDNRLVSSDGIIIFKKEFSTNQDWVLNEHMIDDKYVVPGTTYIQMVYEVAKRLFKTKYIEISDLYFLLPLALDENMSREAHVVLKRNRSNYEIEITSRNSNNNFWEKHAICKVAEFDGSNDEKINLESAKKNLKLLDIKKYEEIGVSAVKTGAHWKCLSSVYHNDNEIIADLEIPKQFVHELDEFEMHPAMLDSAVNVTISHVNNALYLPYAYNSIKIYGGFSEKVSSIIHPSNAPSPNKETFEYDIHLVDNSGKKFADITSYTIKKVNQTISQDKSTIFGAIKWTPQPEKGKSVKLENELLLIQEKNDWAYDFCNELENKLNVINVEIGENKSFIDESCLKISNNISDFKNLVEKLDNKFPEQIVYIVEDLSLDNANKMDVKKDKANNSLLSLFYLIKALEYFRKEKVFEITIITKMVNDVNGNEAVLDILHGSIIGFAKALNTEGINVNCKHVDVDDKTRFETIYNEIGNRDEKNLIISLRGDTRYVEEVEKYNLPMQDTEIPLIKNGGVYVVTGGLGGIGSEVCKMIIENEDVNLVILGRSKLEDVLKINSKKDIINLLQSKCNSFKYLSVDISDYEKLEQEISTVREQFGKIDGVFHCAGIPGKGFIVNKSESDFLNVIDPKISGTLNIGSVTDKDSLDFMVLFSSIVTLTGSPGLVDYTSANAFLDSYCDYRNRNNKRTIAINWPIWGETGMAQHLVEKRSNQIFKPLSNSNGISLLKNILSNHTGRIVIASFQKGVNSNHLKQGAIRFSKTIHDLLKNEKENKPSVKNRNVNYSKIQTGDIDVEEIVSDAWKTVLELEGNIDTEANFFDIGGDSIYATYLVKEIDKRLPKLINISSIFTYPTIRGLVSFINEKNSKKEGRSKVEQQVSIDVEKNIEDLLGKLADGTVSVNDIN